MKEFPKCPVETTLLLISDKWKVLIIRDLTELGYSLKPILDAMYSWGEDFKKNHQSI